MSGGANPILNSGCGPHTLSVLPVRPSALADCVEKVCPPTLPDTPHEQPNLAEWLGTVPRKPRLLDLFCCAGGAAMGYHRAGFEVVGVDIKPQPRYPFEFIQADCLTLDPAFIASFDAIHASPPCQAHSITAKLNPTAAAKHGECLEETRELLIASGKPYVIENVPGAPLRDPIVLCGTMFGLRVYRHRHFECSFWTLAPVCTGHRATTNSSRTYSTFATGAEMICVAGHNFKREDGAAAMGIDWPARREEIAQAIPPAYTQFIGKVLLEAVKTRNALTVAARDHHDPATAAASSAFHPINHR